MKYFGIFTIIYLLGSCITPDTKEEINYNEDQARELFISVKDLLDKEGGNFWNHSLYGPILIVDPESKTFFANQNNETASFESSGAIFKGSLPDTVLVANTAINWGGIRWTMLLQPLPAIVEDRNNLLIHELFHRIQPLIGFDSIYEKSNAHLDTYEGRVLLQLELEALKEALSISNPEKRKYHLTNAFTLRKHRHLNQSIIDAENSLELNEGLAEYTGLILSRRSDLEANVHLISNINSFYNNATFVRSFAYQTIPAYGYLLYQFDPDWHKSISQSTNLTDFLLDAFEIAPHNVSYITIGKENNYNFEGIINRERKRENERFLKISNYKKRFLESPNLILPFQNMNISFDPRNIIPIEDVGTVYPNLQITDNWGILTVKEGALVSSNWSHVIVTAPTEITGVIVEGEGWTLHLNEGWMVSKEGVTYTLEE